MSLTTRCLNVDHCICWNESKRAVTISYTTSVNALFLPLLPLCPPSCADSVVSSDGPTTKTNCLSTTRWRFLARTGHSSRLRSQELSIKRNGPRTGATGPRNFALKHWLDWINSNHHVWHSSCLCIGTNGLKKKSAHRLRSWNRVHIVLVYWWPVTLWLDLCSPILQPTDGWPRIVYLYCASSSAFYSK